VTERYKASCLRNPVIDIPSMLGVTDIPDWCLVEAGFSYDDSEQLHVLTPAHYAAMRV
jgi:hypothetical protein